MAHIKRRGVVVLALCMLALGLPLLAQQQPTAGPPVVEVPGTVPTPVTNDRPSQPAVPTKEVPSPAAPSNAQEAVGWALGTAYVIEYLKRKKWFTFLTEESSARAKTVFGFLAAALTAAGIQFAVSGSLVDAGGASVTITGITLTGVKDVVFQWIAQEGWYRGLIQKR